MPRPRMPTSLDPLQAAGVRRRQWRRRRLPALPGDRLLAEVSRTGARDQAARCGHGRRRPRGGRRVDVERTRRCRRSERNDSLSRQNGSPLPDSNRRHPPYHLAATGRNRRQRFSLVSTVFGCGRFATGCHRLRPRGSITAPSVSAKLRMERPAIGCLQVAALGAFTPREDSQRCRRRFDGPLPDGPDPACSRARHCPN